MGGCLFGADTFDCTCKVIKMTEYKKIRREIILKLLEDFPDTPSNTLARMAKDNNSELFKDKEDARGLIRIYRGASGDQARIDMKMRKYYGKQIQLT